MSIVQQVRNAFGIKPENNAKEVIKKLDDYYEKIGEKGLEKDEFEELINRTLYLSYLVTHFYHNYLRKVSKEEFLKKLENINGLTNGLSEVSNAIKKWDDLMKNSINKNKNINENQKKFLIKFIKSYDESPKDLRKEFKEKSNELGLPEELDLLISNTIYKSRKFDKKRINNNLKGFEEEINNAFKGVEEEKEKLKTDVKSSIIAAIAIGIFSFFTLGSNILISIAGAAVASSIKYYASRKFSKKDSKKFDELNKYLKKLVTTATKIMIFYEFGKEKLLDRTPSEYNRELEKKIKGTDRLLELIKERL